MSQTLFWRIGFFPIICANLIEVPPIVHSLIFLGSQLNLLMKKILLSFAFVLVGVALGAQNNSKPDLSVFPNPATEYISVQDKNDAVGFLSVFNLVGKKVKEFEFVKGEQYSIADLPKGMYLVQILDRGKRNLTTQKIEKR